MKNGQKGIAFVEAILLLLVICLVFGAGYYVWYRNYNSRPPIPTAKTLNNCADEKGITADCATHINGWTTYKSSHSSIVFSYPSSWQAVNNKLANDYSLESFSIYGPNNFELDFNLQTNHVNPALSCALVHFGTVVPLNDQFVIVPTLSGSNKDNVDSINLMTAKYRDSSNQSGCGLGFYLNPVGKTMGFTFSGSYINRGGGYVNTSIPKPQAGYFNLPEVQTAKTIFESFKQ